MAVNCETDKVYLVDNSKNQIPVVVIPEFPSWTAMILLLSVLAVAVTVYKVRLTKIVNQHIERCKT